MPAAISTLSTLLHNLQPTLHAGCFVFAVAPANMDIAMLQPIATFREAEGLSVVVREDTAQAAGLSIMFRAAWITLTVHSDLAAIGLTAAVSTALAAAGISCNVIAATYHDHLFVPIDAASAAMTALNTLQIEALSTPRHIAE